MRYASSPRPVSSGFKRLASPLTRGESGPSLALLRVARGLWVCAFTFLSCSVLMRVACRPCTSRLVVLGFHFYQAAATNHPGGTGTGHSKVDAEPKMRDARLGSAQATTGSHHASDLWCGRPRNKVKSSHESPWSHATCGFVFYMFVVICEFSQMRSDPTICSQNEFPLRRGWVWVSRTREGGASQHAIGRNRSETEGALGRQLWDLYAPREA